MVTAEDYNVAPLAVSQEIVKVKTVTPMQVELVDILTNRFLQENIQHKLVWK